MYNVQLITDSKWKNKGKKGEDHMEETIKKGVKKNGEETCRGKVGKCGVMWLWVQSRACSCCKPNS